MNTRLGIKGFSLAEVMVAAALLGAVSLGVTHVIKLQSDTQKQADGSFETNLLTQQAIRQLLNENACNETFGAGTVIADGLAINAIKNGSGGDILVQGQKYGNNLLELESMTVRNVRFTGSSGPRPGIFDLEIQIKKTFGPKNSLRRNFPVQVEVDGSDRLVRCYSTTGNIIAQAKAETCTSLMGTYDASSDRCTLPATASTDTSQFVKKLGDTMTGALTVNAKVTGNEFCVGTNCRNFNQSGCSVGQVVKKIKADGTVECGNITCTSNTEFFVGLKADGTPNCKPFPTNTCTTNQYVSKVNNDGSVECTPLPSGTDKDCPTSAIRKIAADGTLTCAPDPTSDVAGKACPTGEVMTGFDSSSNPICTATASNSIIQEIRAITFSNGGQIWCPNNYLCLEIFCPLNWQPSGIELSGYTSDHLKAVCKRSSTAVWDSQVFAPAGSGTNHYWILQRTDPIGGNQERGFRVKCSELIYEAVAAAIYCRKSNRGGPTHPTS